MESLIALLGVAGTVIAYVLTRLDQRNARTLLDRDLALLEKAKDHPEIHAPLLATARAEAERLSEAATRSSTDRLLRTARAIFVGAAVTAGIVALVQWSMFGRVSITTPLMGSGVAPWIGRGLTALMAAAAFVAGTAAVAVIQTWIWALTWFLWDELMTLRNQRKQKALAAAEAAMTPQERASRDANALRRALGLDPRQDLDGPS